MSDKKNWALLIANHGRTYLVCTAYENEDVRLDQRLDPKTITVIQTTDALEVWSNLMSTKDGGVSKGTFNTLFEQCLHAVPVTFFSPSAFIWLSDMHEDDRTMYEQYIEQNMSDRAKARVRRAGLALPEDKKR